MQTTFTTLALLLAKVNRIGQRRFLPLPDTRIPHKQARDASHPSLALLAVNRHSQSCMHPALPLSVSAYARKKRNSPHFLSAVSSSLVLNHVKFCQINSRSSKNNFQFNISSYTHWRFYRFLSYNPATAKTLPPIISASLLQSYDSHLTLYVCQ